MLWRLKISFRMCEKILRCWPGKDIFLGIALNYFLLSFFAVLKSKLAFFWHFHRVIFILQYTKIETQKSKIVFYFSIKTKDFFFRKMILKLVFWIDFCKTIRVHPLIRHTSRKVEGGSTQSVTQCDRERERMGLYIVTSHYSYENN